MTDPLRNESLDQISAASAADRDARIEQLLLAGLDHYFLGQYDHAINVWTRVLFFDRGHARARAYIDRARRAQAERQRESEELLHTGTVAYRNGDVKEARRLLQAAIESGAPIDIAFPMLERLNQLEPMPAVLSASRMPRVMTVVAAEPVIFTPRSRTSRVVALAIVVLAVGLAGVLATRSDWRALVGASAPSIAAPLVPVAREVILSVPTRGEMALARARQLAAGGALHDALTALDVVRVTDPQRSDADQLRSEIQRQLLQLERQ
jgi:tetratricopeptide (TPR) repeat protein